MNRRMLAWPEMARRGAAALTTPKTDVAASDVVVERQLAASRLAELARVAAAAIGRASETSASTKWVRRFAGSWLALPLGVRVRLAGISVGTAGVTVEMLQAIKPGPSAPLIWVLPAIVALAGWLAAWGAGPLAGAIAQRRA